MWFRDVELSPSIAPAVHRRRRPARLLTVLALFLALVAGTSAVAAPSASANTKSDWSGRVAGTSITYGWTHDHAWVIASYKDVIVKGSGFVAGKVCAAVPEVGLALKRLCSSTVEKAIASRVKGKPRLANHGVWAAVYPIRLRFTGGTW